MALLTKQECADQTGQTTSTLSTYVLRKKVVLNKKGLIDTTHPTNAAFMEKHGWKSGGASLVAKSSGKKVKPRHQASGDPDFDDADEDDSESYRDGIPGIGTSERRYKHALAKKTEAAEERERLQIARLKGGMVPTELITPLFIQHSQSILTAFKNVIEEILTEYSHIKRFEVAEIAQMRGKMSVAINSGMALAEDHTKKAIKSIIQEIVTKKA